MIVRIIGEGQLTVAAEYLDELNVLDDALAEAVAADDEQRFRQDLVRLLDRVREVGTSIPAGQLAVSDFILPGADSSLRDVRALLTEDGLIPG